MSLLIVTGITLLLLLFYWRLGGSKVERISTSGAIHRVEFHSKNLRATKKRISIQEKRSTELEEVQSIPQVKKLPRPKPAKVPKVEIAQPSDIKVVERIDVARKPAKSKRHVNTHNARSKKKEETEEIDIVNRPHPKDLGTIKSLG